MDARRLINMLYITLLVGVGLGAGALLLDARAEFHQLKQTEAATRKRLSEAEAQLKHQQRILERLQTDPVYVERVIRERLKYARPGEAVFRFEEPAPPPALPLPTRSTDVPNSAPRR